MPLAAGADVRVAVRRQSLQHGARRDGTQRPSISARHEPSSVEIGARRAAIAFDAVDGAVAAGGSPCPAVSAPGTSRGFRHGPGRAGRPGRTAPAPIRADGRSQRLRARIHMKATHRTRKSCQAGLPQNSLCRSRIRNQAMPDMVVTRLKLLPELLIGLAVEPPLPTHACPGWTDAALDDGEEVGIVGRAASRGARRNRSARDCSCI